MSALPFVEDDGGRAEAGYRGNGGDCVVRAITIASGRPYKEIRQLVAMGAARERPSKSGKRSRAASGVFTSRVWFKKLMAQLGFVWTPLMSIGSGCQFHLRHGELPEGRLIVSLSKHYAAVIDGTIHDTHDPCRDGERCVYGYWEFIL